MKPEVEEVSFRNEYFAVGKDLYHITAFVFAIRTQNQRWI